MSTACGSSIQAMDYPETPAEERAELQAIVDSIAIERQSSP